jgi:hypothetical protein
MSALYLSTFSMFEADAMTALGATGREVNPACTTFQELSTFFWGEKGSFMGFQGCQQHICPRDGLEGSSIVDAVYSKKLSGKATHFVSWCWRYTMRTMTSALHGWAMTNNVDASQTFFWICFFCNNQRKLLLSGSAIESSNLSAVFGSRLRRIGCLVVVLDTYDGPFYTTRIWCIFEVYTANVQNVRIDVTLPEDSHKDFYGSLQRGEFSSLSAALTAIDTENAEASFQADADAIKNLIRETSGFVSVDDSVKYALMRWLASAFETCLQRNSISEATVVIFKLIANGKTGDLELKDWMQALRRHPALMDYLETDQTRLDVDFATMDKSIDGTIDMPELERFLGGKNKLSYKTLAMWLGKHAASDPELQTIRNHVESQLKDKKEQLWHQLVMNDDALNALGSSMTAGSYSHILKF